MTVAKKNDSGGIKYTNLTEAAKKLGGAGGKSNSPPKQNASRTNGKLGGRPTKK
jgi:hypothetical protein